MAFLPTADPTVQIEDQGIGWVRYRRDDGRRWEVHGTCVKLGNCLVGAVIDGEEVTTLVRAQELAVNYAGMDVPITPEFKGCCAFEFVELDRVVTP